MMAKKFGVKNFIRKTVCTSHIYPPPFPLTYRNDKPSILTSG